MCNKIKHLLIGIGFSFCYLYSSGQNIPSSFNEDYQNYQHVSGIAAKQTFYDALVKKYANVKKVAADLDDMTSELAVAYLRNNNLKKYHSYTAKVKNRYRHADNVIYALDSSINAGKNLDVAEDVLTDCIKVLADYKFDPADQSAHAENNSRILGALELTYGKVLFNKKQFADAIPALEKANVFYKNTSAPSHQLRIDALLAIGKYREALDEADTSIRSLNFTKKIMDQLKPLYLKVNGDEKTWDVYKAKLDLDMQKEAERRVKPHFMQNPKLAPDFSIKDIDGNVITLKSLKNKVIILDFWASWCSACKATFPGLQLAVNKYKNDPDVVFLFIDTYEQIPNAVDEARRYIKSKGYTFHIAVDEQKDKYPVVELYDAGILPTKIVINRQGKMFYRTSGSGEFGCDEVLAQEMIAIIEQAKL